jgi:hypothetical protein
MKKFLLLDKPQMGSDSAINLMVHGQGVFIFKYNEINVNEINVDDVVSSNKCIIYFYNTDNSEGLRVEFAHGSVKVNTVSDGNILIDKKNKKGLSGLKGAYYWFSIDSQNQQLYAGIGEARLDNIIYKYKFAKKHKKFLEDIVELQIGSESKSFLKPLRLLRDPITKIIPLVIKDVDELTMNDIANSSFMPKANLSVTAQKLYHCISGKNFILDDADFPDFSKAIEYSIATPKMWCNKTLKKKSTEFNKDKPNLLETYLRITLGENNGESPGIPYVMEIWPVGHYSPIHNHSEANAIIRVLHGEINVSLYPFLCAKKDGITPFAVADFKKDDVTWISPTLNQTHKLLNKKTSADTCITIQCYMYDIEDSGHYDYFDYLDEGGNILQYDPDSDMDFISFKNKMKEEWNAR